MTEDGGAKVEAWMREAAEELFPDNTGAFDQIGKGDPGLHVLYEQTWKRMAQIIAKHACAPAPTPAPPDIRCDHCGAFMERGPCDVTTIHVRPCICLPRTPAPSESADAARESVSGTDDHELVILHHKWVADDDLSHEEVQDKLREYLKGKAGDTVCQVCALPNPPWFIESQYWNLVMPERVGVLCLRCFAELSHSLGVTGCWRLVPDPDTNSLVLGQTPIQKALASRSVPGTPRMMIDRSNPNSKPHLECPDCRGSCCDPIPIAESGVPGTVEEERKAFIEWANEKGGDVRNSWDGELFQNILHQSAWCGWQAGRAALREQSRTVEEDKMNKEEIKQAQELIDSVCKGTGELRPVEAAFPEKERRKSQADNSPKRGCDDRCTCGDGYTTTCPVHGYLK